MTMIISCVSFKGGVGKTTLAQNLAVAFAHAGHKTCIVDCDDSLNSVQWGELRAKEAPDLPIIQAIGERDENKFPHTVKKLGTSHDVIIIDSPPSQSNISQMVVLMSDLILVPLMAKGLQETNTIVQLVEKIQGLELTQNRSIPVYFLLNEYNPRIVHMKKFKQQMKESFPDQLLESYFSPLKAYYRAPYSGMGVTEYLQLEDSAGKAAHEVEDLIQEVATIINQL